MSEDVTGARASSVRRLDPRSLRALAHPLRLRILAALRDFGPATASQLAVRLGESSGATSYHLRQLATYEFVAPEPGRGTGRERWWRPVHYGTWIDRDLLSHPNPEVSGAMSSFLHDMAIQHTQDLTAWLESMASWSPEWRRSQAVSDFQLRLTPELAEGLVSKLHKIIQGYGEAPEGAAGAERVRIQLHVFPRPSQ